MTAPETEQVDGTNAAPASGSRMALAIGLVMAASMVAQAFGRFAYAVLLPAINDDLLDSYTLAGFLGTANLVAYLIGSAVVSVLATRVEPLVVLRLGLAGSVAGLALSAVAPGFAVLGLALFVAGAGGAAVWVPAPAIGAAAAPPQRRGLAIGLIGAGIGFGILVVGPLTTAVRALSGNGDEWRAVYGSMAAIGAVILVAIVAFVRLPAGTGGGARVRLAAIRAVPGWVPLVTAYAAFGLAYPLYLFFLVARLTEEAGWSDGSASLVFTLAGGMSMVGGLLFGPLSDRLGRAPTMVGVFCLMATAPLLTLTGVGAAIIAGAALFGLCMSGAPTTISATVADSLSGRAFAASFGVLTVIFGVAQIFGPQLGGVIRDTTDSFTWAFLGSTLGAVIGAVAALVLGRVQRRSVGTEVPEPRAS